MHMGSAQLQKTPTVPPVCVLSFHVVSARLQVRVGRRRARKARHRPQDLEAGLLNFSPQVVLRLVRVLAVSGVVGRH